MDAFAGSVFEEVWKNVLQISFFLILHTCLIWSPFLQLQIQYCRLWSHISDVTIMWSYQLVPLCFVNIDCIMKCQSILVAVQTKVQVCGYLDAGIAGLNPTRGMDSLSVGNVVCCHVEISATG